MSFINDEAIFCQIAIAKYIAVFKWLEAAIKYCSQKNLQNKNHSILVKQCLS